MYAYEWNVLVQRAMYVKTLWINHLTGISPAPECFQLKLDHKNLKGLKGIYKIQDDNLITGCGASKEEAVMPIYWSC